jgi:catechol 2,3-dioxygenase-like lactoylglutathione lyase family enzyme
VSGPLGVNHIAVVTADLDGYRAVYEDAMGLATALVLGPDPGHGRQAVMFAGNVVLHVFEADPPGTGSGMLHRGRLDHLGFTVRDEAALAVLRTRLLDAGASSGDIRPLGWLLSLRYRDPDGFEGEINCFNPAFDPVALRDQDEVLDPQWLERTERALRKEGWHP